MRNLPSSCVSFSMAALRIQIRQEDQISIVAKRLVLTTIQTIMDSA